MKPRIQTIMGHRIPEPRLTAKAVLLFVLYIALPVFLLGALADLLLELLFGTCTGLWCL